MKVQNRIGGRVLLKLSLLPLLGCGELPPESDEVDKAGTPAVIAEQAYALQLESGGPFGADGVGGTLSSLSSVTYSVDKSTIFPNPERGFYHHAETRSSSYTGLSQTTLSSYRSRESISLVLRLIYLDSFRNSPLSTSFLDSVRADFDRVRAAGLKVVLRFAYTSSSTKPYGDASKDRVLGHITQLAPILRAHAGIIATVQVGFIGAWGEWYYTDFFGDQGNISATQWEDRKSVVEALLGSLPSSRTVQLRTPAFKRQFYGSTALSATEAFTGTARARVGHHNDCFLASANDFGTYSNVTADKAYLAAENLYLPQGGETCATSTYSSFANASADMEKLHYSYLNRDYNRTVLDSWGTNLDIVQRRLGYRLALLDGAFSSGARPGGELQVSMNLRNDGYAPPYNPRGIELIARNQSTGARLAAKLPIDPRRFVPGATHNIAARICVPDGTPEGTYALNLFLPDPEPALHDRPEYAIRLADVGLWDATTGYNHLNQTITISAAISSSACSAGSVRLDPR